MRTMKRKWAAVGLGFVVFCGCNGPGGSERSITPVLYPHSTKGTLSETPEEHFRRVASVHERDSKALKEDLDLLFLTERPTRLSRWHSK